MRSNPNRFLHATLCFENLSSGENLAGCADNVGFPSGPVFCQALGQKMRGRRGVNFVMMNSRSKLMLFCVFQQREKKTRQNRATYTHRENDVIYKVFVP